MKIARVFPTKTNMCPTDKDCYFGTPDLFTPLYDRIHISVTFTWDIIKASTLAFQWERYGKIKVGGVAMDGESREPMLRGMYLREGVTITTRGCPNNCWFCLVGKKFIELDEFPIGNIIQDNNILASSDCHWEKVIKMLRTQRAIEFKGGLDANRLTDSRIEDLKSLKIRELWFACDSPSTKHLERVRPKLGDFNRNKLRCFVLIGKDMQEEEQRLRKVFELGFLPFAQLYQPPDKIEYSREWKQFQRQWTRPAIMKSIMKRLS